MNLEEKSGIQKDNAMVGKGLVVDFVLKGSFTGIKHYLDRLLDSNKFQSMETYAEMCCQALADNTPRKTGKTANSWTYEIEHESDSSTIIIKNENVKDGVPIAIILDKGHGLEEGGWVAGRHYIDPAIDPVYKDILEKVWEEVRRT